MNATIQKNLAYLRTVGTPELPELGSRLYETFSAILSQQQTIAQQVNGNVSGQPESPPQINGLKVTASNGHFAAEITDNNTVYRDVHYYLAHADNAQFTNPQIIHLGHSRNHNIFLGNATRYWQAYSAYASSPPSAPVYHGSQVKSHRGHWWRLDSRSGVWAVAGQRNRRSRSSTEWSWPDSVPKCNRNTAPVRS